MIVQLTPSIKFVCDRCGKEEFSDENGSIICPAKVEFRKRFSEFRGHETKEGEVCADCLAEFWEFAENFFDEVNKEKEEQE